MKQSTDAAHRPARGQPWQAAALSGLLVLVIGWGALGLGASPGVAFVLALPALALAVTVVLCWPDRFGGTEADSTHGQRG